MTKIEKLEKQIEELDKHISDLVSTGKGGSMTWCAAELELNHLLEELSKAQVKELEK